MKQLVSFLLKTIKAFFVGSNENKIQLLDISVSFSLKEEQQKASENESVQEIKINENTAIINNEENITKKSFGTSFKEISSYIIKLMEDYYNQYGKFPRSWGGYNFTDIGLNPADWESPIGHIIYTTVGDRLQIRPEQGYGFEAVKVDGSTVRMSYKLNYNFMYYIANKTWYYHKKDPANIIDINTFRIYSTETGEIITEDTEEKVKDEEQIDEIKDV